MNSSIKTAFHWKRWLFVVMAAFLVLWFAKPIILKSVVEAVSSQMIGAKTSLGSFSLNIFTQKIRITNFQIYNEQGFPPKVFFNASEILVNANLLEVLKGKLHFPLIVFRLDKMIVCKNAQGKLNVNELKIVQDKLHDKTKAPAPNFKIDELKLNIEQVVVEDDSKTPPVIQAYQVDLKDKTIRNVDGVPKLVGLVLVEALKPTALRSAGMLAATTLLGVGFLPGLAVGIAIASDDAVSSMPIGASELYRTSLAMVKRLGTIKRTDESAGDIWAQVYDCDITIKIQKQGWNQSKIIIKARKYFLAKPEIAAGLLYQLKEELK